MKKTIFKICMLSSILFVAGCNHRVPPPGEAAMTLYRPSPITYTYEYKPGASRSAVKEYF